MTTAVILAAGQGMRLRPYTEDRPKCLVPFHGRPIIDYTLETLRRCGLTEICVVGGYRSDALRDHLAGQEITLYSNPEYDHTNMVVSLFCAAAALRGDVVVSYGDIIFGPDILDPLLVCPDDFAITSSVNWRELWEERMSNPLSDAETFKVDDQGYVTELGLKPRGFDEVQGQYMGLFGIRAAAWPRVFGAYETLQRTSAGVDQMYMTAFLQHLIDGGLRAKAVPVTGRWMEVDTLDDLGVRY